MSELLKDLKMERVQGSSAVLNYSNFDYWVNWDDIVEIVEKHKQPILNENQQIVLEWLKEEYFDSYVKSVLSNLYFYVNMTAIGDLENRKIQLMVKAYEELDDKEFIQVLAAFTEWGKKEVAE
ncbi:hypothetical protein [Enterococcus avium]|uniref:hypothetical protein n=1 Tax=Enterococcus avium TaxID=33945 RepID=UPI003D0AC5A1